MTPDDQPTAPADLHPETAVICASRPGHTAGEPHNVPIVLASNFHADTMAAPGTGQDSRAYSRTDATPTWEAFETAIGQVEGGHAVAFSSGMASIAAVLDLVPAGGRIVAPKDCYFGVGELLADAQKQRRWAVDRVDLTDTASVQAAIAGAALLWLETPPTRCSRWPTCPPCAPPAATPGPSSASTTPSPRHCCNSPWHSARTCPYTAPPNSSAATPTCCPASPSPASRASPGACATAAAYPAPPPAPWKPSWRCAACAPLPCGSTAVSATLPNSPAGSTGTPPSAAYATPASPATPDTKPPPRR
jgi:Cys/Met metabolism PLP-dependent enzyme